MLIILFRIYATFTAHIAERVVEAVRVVKCEVGDPLCKDWQLVYCHPGYCIGDICVGMTGKELLEVAGPHWLQCCFREATCELYQPKQSFRREIVRIVFSEALHEESSPRTPELSDNTVECIARTKLRHYGGNCPQ